MALDSSESESRAEKRQAVLGLSILAWLQYRSTLHEEEQNRLITKIGSKVKSSGDCLLWQGEIRTTRNGIIRCLFPVSECWQQIRVHRLTYYTYSTTTVRPILDFTSATCNLCNCEISVMTEHLSLEPAVSNSQRNSFFAAKSCFGHHIYDDFIM